MVGVKLRIAAVAVAASVLSVLAGCTSPFLTRIQQEVAKYPFTATAYKFLSQWGNPQPQYSFGSAVVKVDTAGFVYVADSTFRIRKFTSTGSIVKTYQLVGSTGLTGNVYDMAFDTSGNMYVATSGTTRIQKYDVSGNLVVQWGTSAIGTAAGIAVDAAGDVFVLDSSNSKVWKFDTLGNAGTPVSWATAASPSGIAADANNIVYVTAGTGVTKYDSSGGIYAGFWNITLSSPRGIAVGTSGFTTTYYVADSGNSRIVETTDGTTSAHWGASGTGNGQFTSVGSVAVDSSGNVYTADLPSNGSVAGGLGRIQEFDNSGTYITSWSNANLNGNGQMTTPTGVAFDSAGNSYVVDSGNSRIEKFDPNGAYLGQYGNSSIFGPGLGSIAIDAAGNVYAADQVHGYVQVLSPTLSHIKNIGSGTLSNPQSVALDTAGNIYVTDTGSGKVFVFDSNGYTTHIPQTIGTTGTLDGQFEVPVGVAVDSAGSVYVTDFDIFTPRLHAIQKFDSKGNFVAAWGTNGTGNGQVQVPLGITVDKYNNAYVSDFIDHRIEKFDSNGNFLGAWGGVGVGGGTFGWPFDAAVGPSGKVLVSDATNNIVELFDPAH